MIRSTASNVNGRECSVPHSMINLYNYALKPTRDTIRERVALLHFNQGIDEVEGMGGQNADFNTMKRDRLISFGEDLREYFCFFQRELPTIPFIHAASTRPDSVTSDRFRFDIQLLNDTARAMCKRYNIPFNDLYQYCVDLDLKTFDGRHFRTGISKATISPQTVNFSKPYVFDPQVYVTGVKFNQAFRKRASIPLTAHIANSMETWTVAYYAGATKVGESSTAPYQVVWSNPPAGEHMMRAEATSQDKKIISRYLPVVVYEFPLRINAAGNASGGYLGDKSFYDDGVFGFASHWTVIRQVSGTLDGVPGEVLRTCRTNRSANDPIQYNLALPLGKFKISVIAHDPQEIKINGKALVVKSGKPVRITTPDPISPPDGKVTITVTGSGGTNPAKIVALEVEAVELTSVTSPTTSSVSLTGATASFNARTSTLALSTYEPMQIHLLKLDGRGVAVTRQAPCGQSVHVLESLPAGVYILNLTGKTGRVTMPISIAARSRH